MGAIPEAPFEVRLAATLFLLVLGVADIAAAWQVYNFASFSPAGVARLVAPDGPPGSMNMGASGATEVPVDLDAIDAPQNRIEQSLLVQDTHVHIPAYALTAAALSLIVFGLRLSSQVRSVLVTAAFAAPIADFAGLWGAHIAPGAGVAFGALAVTGGFLMGAVYVVIAALTIYQCWIRAGRSGAVSARQGAQI
jgi:hypothetical protein